MTLFGKLLRAAPVTAAILLSACGGGGAGGVTTTVTSGSSQQFAPGEPAPGSKPIVLADFTAAVQNASCAGERSDLYVIDNTHVLWDRAGRCADNSYAYTLYGNTPQDVLCTQMDTIAGPRTECKDKASRELFDGLLKNLDKADLGLGATHKVEKTSLVKVERIGDGFEPLLLDGYSAITKPRTVVVKDQAALEALLAEHYGSRRPDLNLPKVDFTRQMVVGVFLGLQDRGCRYAAITKVAAEGRQLRVDYNGVDLMTFAVCTEALSSPAALAIVDRTDGAVEFVNVAPEQVKFSVVDSTRNSGITKEQNVVIRDEATFSAMWAIHSPGADMPKIDFSQNMVIAAFHGSGMSCSGVAISHVERVGKALNVNVVKTEPGPTVLCAATVATPAYLVQVPRTDDPVNFRTITTLL